MSPRKPTTYPRLERVLRVWGLGEPLPEEPEHAVLAVLTAVLQDGMEPSAIKALLQTAVLSYELNGATQVPA